FVDRNGFFHRFRGRGHRFDGRGFDGRGFRGHRDGFIGRGGSRDPWRMHDFHGRRGNKIVLASRGSVPPHSSRSNFAMAPCSFGGSRVVGPRGPGQSFSARGGFPRGFGGGRAGAVGHGGFGRGSIGFSGGDRGRR